MHRMCASRMCALASFCCCPPNLSLYRERCLNVVGMLTSCLHYRRLQVFLVCCHLISPFLIRVRAHRVGRYSPTYSGSCLGLLSRAGCSTPCARRFASSCAYSRYTRLLRDVVLAFFAVPKRKRASCSQKKIDDNRVRTQTNLCCRVFEVNH